MKNKIKPGDKFIAVIREGFKTLGGVEAAGRKLGPFTATKTAKIRVYVGSRHFNYTDFEIVKQ